MKTSKATLVFCLAAVQLAVVAGCQKKDPKPSVKINNSSWQVEIAETRAKRYRGMSGRIEVGEDEGMLFVYPDSRVRDYCMRGCLVPLDIAFIDENLKVIKTYTMQPEPGQVGKMQYSSETPAKYVFEAAGGAFAAAEVQEGQVVIFSKDMPDATKAEPGP